jgi:hypothetical protein
MRMGLVEMMVRMDRTTWLVVGGLWILTTLVVLWQRGAAGRTGFMRVTALLTLASATSLVGLALATAVSVARIVWRADTRSELTVARGDTWRRLRGPTVQLVVEGKQDVALPTVNATGEWILHGLLSGRPIAGLPPAPAKPPEVGGARICGTSNEACRGWPAEWPDPARAPALDELSWAKEWTRGALAYDVESSLFLQATPSLAQSGRALELVGRITNDAPREGATALFVLRRIDAGRLSAVRVVALPASPAPGGGSATDAPQPSGPEYRLQRAEASLRSAPWVARWIARPLLVATGAVLPITLLVWALCPLWLAMRMRRLGAVRRELTRPLTLGSVEGPKHHGPVCLATVLGDAVFGDVTLPRGAMVEAAVLFDDGRAVSSWTWFELPSTRDTDERAGARLDDRRISGADEPDAARASGSPTTAEGPYRSNRIGLLIPADSAPFRRAARAWVLPYAYVGAVIAAGLACLAPALVAAIAVAANR